MVGLVLLLAGGHLGSAAQNWIVFGTNETLHQTREAEAKGSQQTNQTAQKRHSPVTYRLKTYQLQNPGHPDKQKLLAEEQTFRAVNAFEPASELLEQKTVQTETALLVHGSDLNLPTSEPAYMEPKVNSFPPYLDLIHLFVCDSVCRFFQVEQQLPPPARSVSVHCGEEKVIVEVKLDFLGNGCPLTV